MNIRTKQSSMKRMTIQIHGAVQGVGFRPFIYNLARGLELKGFVQNTAQGVWIEAEAEAQTLEIFLRHISQEKPEIASIKSLKYSWLDPCFYPDFQIRESNVSEDKTALILPDIATCPACLSEIFDPADRRYLYPFTNCTNCGPRYSIIQELPYDRQRTSMKNFKMCPECDREFHDPEDRRFHAQPNACPVCGPQVRLSDNQGKKICESNDAILLSARMIKEGKIVAVKGIGGYHLVADAGNEEAVSLLRRRKQRDEKPFAVMFPTIEALEKACCINEKEKFFLKSPEAPIVLLEKKTSSGRKGITDAVAPSNPYLGVMLPYTPLHHILLREVNGPVVATSGNISDEPICIDDKDTFERLGYVADFFLTHNRSIVRHVDDSIIRLMANRSLVLRRARGYAPLPVTLKSPIPEVVALGADLKNTVSLSVGNQVFLSQHIGDLETKIALKAFQKTEQDLQRLYGKEIKNVVCDAHPEYFSTKHALSRYENVQTVQHHHAHIVSCMAENQLEDKVLGVAWDGTGYGEDDSVWGGEFLVVDFCGFKRLAHLRSFLLPGADAAVREPRRSAMGLLFEVFGQDVLKMKDLPPLRSFDEKQSEIICDMLTKKIHTPRTSSAGRLFDAVSSIIGLKQVNRFEGQAAMALEYLADKMQTKESYSFKIVKKQDVFIADWELLLQELIADLRAKEKLEKISAKFHNALAEIIVGMAKKFSEKKVVLSGGCFQNKYLTEKTVERLTEEGFSPYWHQTVPPNDGCISVGQCVIMGHRLKKK